MAQDRWRVTLRSSEDIVQARYATAKAMDAIGAGTVRRTRFVTAVSEIARNTIVHGGGGEMSVLIEEELNGRRVSVVFEDRGPGIADPEAAMRDGFSTRGSLGMGLGGAKRLSDGFSLEPREGGGLRVVMTATA